MIEFARIILLFSIPTAVIAFLFSLYGSRSRQLQKLWGQNLNHTQIMDLIAQTLVTAICISGIAIHLST
jgi:hypothetical protein